MSFQSFVSSVEKNLLAYNFSSNSSNLLMGYKRPSVEDARKLFPPPKESAVMMLLFPRNGNVHTLFMMRPDGTGIHSNQLSFPGGKIESGESDLEAALRETFEEVGIASNHILTIGKLSSLFIPPSNFVVQPFIGAINHEPDFVPNADEVYRLIEFPIESFLKNALIREKEVFIPSMNKTIAVKYFDVFGQTLWGATAMMIQEFRKVMGFES